MNKFIPIDEDLKIFNDLKTKIDMAEKDILKKCFDIQEKKN